MIPIPWWLPPSYAVRAVIAMILGTLMIIFPAAGLATFVLFVGAFVAADGVVALLGAFAGRKHARLDWPMVLYGVLGIALGIGLLLFPGLSLIAFVFAVALWMVMVGIATLFSSGRWRKTLPHPWLAIALTVLAILFGFYLLVFPLAGVAAIPFMVGMFAFLWGAMMLATAYELWYRRGQAEQTI